MTRRFVVVAQTEKMCCVLWLNVDKVSQCYLYTNNLFRQRGWGDPTIGVPIEVTESEAINVASNDAGVCQFLGIAPEVGLWA